MIHYGVNTDDKTQLEAALWQLGVDVKKGVEAVECEHTTAKGIKVNGVYYLGSERFDREWVMSGYASFEARLISKGDLSMIKEYQLWQDMLERCFSEKYQTRQPTYKDCNVSNNFLNYSYFYEWCQEQIGFGKVDEKGRSWCLDKDLLFVGNKTYS